MTNFPIDCIAPVVPALTIAEFNALPKNEQAVLIAKDVIAQVEASKYIPEVGVYVLVEGLDVSDNSDIKENFDEFEACRVCALGSLLMSATKFKNKVCFADVDGHQQGFADSVNVKEVFESVFSQRQLALIEIAFEGSGIYSASYAQNAFDKEVVIGERVLNKIDKFSKQFERFDDDENRLLAIMNNIIENNGVFKI